MTTAQLYDSADTVIQQQLSQITGVGQITLGGGALPSVRVELEPDKLAQLRHRARGCARRNRRGQRRQRQGPYRSGRSALRGDFQRSGEQGRGLSRSW